MCAGTWQLSSEISFRYLPLLRWPSGRFPLAAGLNSPPSLPLVSITHCAHVERDFDKAQLQRGLYLWPNPPRWHSRSVMVDVENVCRFLSIANIAKISCSIHQLANKSIFRIGDIVFNHIVEAQWKVKCNKWIQLSHKKLYKCSTELKPKSIPQVRPCYAMLMSYILVTYEKKYVFSIRP